MTQEDLYNLSHTDPHLTPVLNRIQYYLIHSQMAARYDWLWKPSPWTMFVNLIRLNIVNRTTINNLSQSSLMISGSVWLRAGPSCTHRAGWSCSVGCAESWLSSFYVFDYFVLTDAAVSIPGHAHSATAILFYTWYVFLDGMPAFCEQKEALMSYVIFYKLHMKKHFLKKWHNVTLTIPYCSSSSGGWSCSLLGG